MARFTVTETVETTYEVNIDEDGEFIGAWHDGEVHSEDLIDFLAALSPVEMSVTERVIERG